MSRYLEIVFRSKLRLLVLVLLLPLVLSGLDFYLWRSYEATETVHVDDPFIFGQNIGMSLGYNIYQTPAENAVKLFSNLLGTQGFNDAVGDKLTTDGVIHSARERSLLIASLSQLTLTPGGIPSSGSGGGSSGSSGPTGGDHTMILHYVCPREFLCLDVLSVVIDVYRVQYADLLARAAATSRAIYESQLTAAEADYAAAIAAVQQHQAQQAKNSRQAQGSDPILAALQRNVDTAQKEIEAAKTQLNNIDTITQVSNGMTSDMYVLDGPTLVNGLYGIRGLRSTNLKTDAIVWASSLLAAVVYVLLIAFLDRTVRDPDQIKAKLGKSVIIIPSYGTRQSSRGKAKKAPA